MPFVTIILFILVLSGCGEESGPRHYTEIVIDAPQQMPAAIEDLPAGQTGPHAGMDMARMPVMPTADDAVAGQLHWDLPSGWKQEAGDAMRLATLRLAADPGVFDCSITSLGGMAGGIEANLTRWMKQISLEITDQEFTRFVRSVELLKTKAGAGAAVYDFIKLQKGADGATKSILAAVLYLNEATVFVKMSGSIEALKVNRAQFIELVKSIRIPIHLE